jgi:hypothetical protein
MAVLFDTFVIVLVWSLLVVSMVCCTGRVCVVVVFLGFFDHKMPKRASVQSPHVRRVD